MDSPDSTAPPAHVRRIVLVGPPGSGKGTQCRRLSAWMGVAHISTGEILRQRRSASELDESIAGAIERGRLAPDDFMSDIVAARIDRPDCRRGFLMDGYPRTLVQAKTFDEMLHQRGHRVDAMICLTAPTDALIARIARRAADEGRTDDDPPTIEHRLSVYRDQTRPVIERYDGCVAVHRIDATGSIDEVFADIRHALSAG